MGFFPDEHKAYVYEPKWEKLVDLNPDHRPADSDLVRRVNDDGSFTEFLVVRGLGVLTATGVAEPVSGRVHPLRVGSLMKDEIGYSPLLP
jgi:hypothetical protein